MISVEAAVTAYVVLSALWVLIIAAVLLYLARAS